MRLARPQLGPFPSSGHGSSPDPPKRLSLVSPNSISPADQALGLCAPFCPAFRRVPFAKLAKPQPRLRGLVLSLLLRPQARGTWTTVPFCLNPVPLKGRLEDNSEGDWWVFRGILRPALLPFSKRSVLPEGERLRDCLPAGRSQLLRGSALAPDLSLCPCAFLSWREMSASPPAPALVPALGD